MGQVWNELAATFSPVQLAERIAGWAPDVLVALVSLVAFWLLWKLADRGLALIMKRAKVDRTAAAFVSSVTKVVLMAIAIVTALGQIGVNTASILASMGVVGLTIGFAARDTLSNIISGLFIFWDRPFVLGDLVEIGDDYGRVDHITMRSTRLVTPEGRMIAIPNSVVVNSAVASYTNFPHLRLEVDATVGVNEDLGRIRTLLLDLVEGDPRFMKDPRPDMVVTALNDYNVAVRFRAWLADEQHHIAVRFELRERTYEALRAADVDMPYETLEVRTRALDGAA